MEIDNLTYLDLMDYWHYRQDLKPVRIDKKLAREILAKNQSVIIGGHIYYFELKNLGLDIYEITPVKKSDGVNGTFVKKL